MPSRTSDGVLLVAHGTVTELSDMPAFLTEIRHGRPPSAHLVTEMTRRYQVIGGSPLLNITREQASALEKQVQLPVLFGMRFGECRIAESLRTASEAGIRRLITLPLAPFSVELYVRETENQLDQLKTAGDCTNLDLIAVGAWYQHPRLIEAHRAAIALQLMQSATPDLPIIVTAHSLPQHVIDSGDQYAALVRASADALQAALGQQVTVAYQSQGDGSDGWLGPSLEHVIQVLAERGVHEVVVYPMGFLSEHVETLYDLDHEAQSLARQLGITMLRVPALNAHPELILCMRDLIDVALS
jgi:protoporphyrin/coproporphyrin ferrochelatase